ncbi:MAG: SymE family type I addiction module toxin [Taibaiella sp.]|nr:SymE family type I addiction module toxin [Taibaiella sp.]
MQNTRHKNRNVPLRTLKVYQKIILRHSRFYCRSYTVQFPEIRLMGKWLADCGFKPGQHIWITQEAGKLTITRASIQ